MWKYVVITYKEYLFLIVDACCVTSLKYAEEMCTPIYTANSIAGKCNFIWHLNRLARKSL